MGRSWSVGLVIGDIANTFVPEVVRGVEEVGWRQKTNLILCNTDCEAEKKMAYVRSLLDKDVDGPILVSQNFTKEEVRVLNLADVPLVTVNRVNEGLPSDYVGVDNVAGVKLAKIGRAHV